jgi:hypothetical protein
MVESIIGWDKLMKIDYKLGIELIVKAFLNTFLWDPDRRKWLEKFNKYSPVSAGNLQVNISKENLFFLKFQHISESPIFGSDAFEFYACLQHIYEKYRIFTNKKASTVTDNLKIKEIVKYLDTWKGNNITIDNYLKLRISKYSEKINGIKSLVNEYNNNRSSETKNNLLTEIKEIEVAELTAVTR